MAFLTDGQDDHAVIIGLQNYPGLDDVANGVLPLSGPENDANDFYNWIISPTGGNVPLQNVIKIISSDYPVSTNGYADVLPAGGDIINVFEKIRHRSQTSLKNHLGSKIGRRLYIFMSGHGIAPSTFGNKLEKEAALLMCNVPPDNKGGVSYHIPGGYTANWFCENDCYDEVFLFMDCCRDPVSVNAINMFLPAKGNKENTTRFYALSTKWSRRSREKSFDGKMRGIFTKVLLEALNGASAVIDPQDSQQAHITGKSLRSFLYNNLNQQIDPQFEEPDIEYYPKANEGADIIVANFDINRLSSYPAEIKLSNYTGANIEVYESNLLPFTTITVQDPNQVIHLNLPKGKYLLNGIVDNKLKSVRFDILGTESPGSRVVITL